MKKVFLVLLGCVLFSAGAFAQRGNNQIGVAADASVPTGDLSEFSNAGFGGTVKVLYGIGKAGQLTLTSGYVSFTGKETFKDLLGADKITQTIVPVLVGYRHNFDGFYAEPQIGYGFYASKIKGGILDSKDSGGAFTWAAGIGYIFRSFEVGVRYQSANKNNEGVGMIGFQAGYNFSL